MQSKAKQRKAKQSKAKQSKAKQLLKLQSVFFHMSVPGLMIYIYDVHESYKVKLTLSHKSLRIHAYYG